MDSDNRKTTYTYDSYKRVTGQRAYSWDSGTSQWVEKTCELKEFYYDANIFDANYSQNIVSFRQACMTSRARSW